MGWAGEMLGVTTYVCDYCDTEAYESPREGVTWADGPEMTVKEWDARVASLSAFL
jgi:hypothetical protein